MSQHARRSLGDAVRRRRLELGWTQEQLAERISAEGEYVRQSEISRIESGRVGLPRRERLERLASALGLPLMELLLQSGWAGAVEHVPEQPASDNLLSETGNLTRNGHEPPAPSAAQPPRERIARRHRAPVSAADQHDRDALRQALQTLRTEADRLAYNRQTAASIMRRFDRIRLHIPARIEIQHDSAD